MRKLVLFISILVLFGSVFTYKAVGEAEEQPSNSNIQADNESMPKEEAEGDTPAIETNSKEVSANGASMEDIEKRLLEEQNKRLEAELECLRNGKHCEIYKSETEGYRGLVDKTINVVNILIAVLISFGAYNIIKSNQYKKKAEEELKEVRFIKEEVESIRNGAKTTYEELEVESSKRLKIKEAEIVKLVKTEMARIKEESEKQRIISKLWSEAKFYANKKDYIESLSRIQRLIKILEKDGNEVNLANAYSDWGVILLDIAISVTGNARCNVLVEAKKKFQKALDLGCDKASYNMACYYSLMNDSENCKIWLEKAREAYSKEPRELLIQHKEHMLKDRDLDNVRGEQWFKEFMDSLD